MKVLFDPQSDLKLEVEKHCSRRVCGNSPCLSLPPQPVLINGFGVSLTFSDTHRTTDRVNV